MTTIQSLIDYIKSHDNCDAVAAGNCLIVTSDVVMPDKTLARDTETIPATMTAVREWLGY